MNISNSRLDRMSNIECLRILSMFLILVVHADFFALGKPTLNEIYTFPLESTTRFFIESISICAVNVFIIISGWFGIKPKLKSIFNFLFQCTFFLFGIGFISCITTGKIGSADIKGCLLLLDWNWFIKAYLMLYILSPVLNSFVEHTDKKTFRLVLFFFFIFQTVYGWLSNGVGWFKNGYSTISFVGIYLLMRYFRLFDTFRGGKISIIIYLFCVILITIFAILQELGYIHSEIIYNSMYSYINPLVIIESLSLFFIFLQIQIKSKIVNLVAASSFAVFLLHSNPNIAMPIFVPFIKNIYDSHNGLACLGIIFLTLVGIFILAILLDQVRIYIGIYFWKKIEKRL